MKSPDSIRMVAVSATALTLLMIISRNSFPSPAVPLVGLYEYVNSPSQQEMFTLQPIFLDWNDAEAVAGLQNFLRRTHQERRMPLITLEPFPDRAHGRSNADLLGDVLAGRHDKALQEISRVLAASPGVVLLRFAHEMDMQDQYPWAFRDPRNYRTLYRYVHSKISANRPSNVRWVWSPAGNSQADRYWPGDNYVDLIGLSIYSSRALSPDHSLESFKQQVEQKRWLHRRFGRTLLVAEAGVSGSAKDQQRWLQEAISSLQHFPEVCGLVYFHAPQPRWMPLPTGHEDWSLKPDGLAALIKALPLPARQGLTCEEI